MKRNLGPCRRIVVKAGTTVLTSREGNFSHKRLEKLGSDLLGCLKSKKQTVLVSSGAIARGIETIGLDHRPKSMSRLQACAAVGQGKLMHDYEKFFAKKGIHTAQLLLTRDGLEDRKRFLKARQTFEELLKMKMLPIVNENDSVATDEIGFGDNDVLSVQVAHLIHADLVVILSDVDGFFLKDGSRIRQVSSVEEIDKELVSHLQDRQKKQNVGGMKAKLQAAREAMRLGIPLLIIEGKKAENLQKALDGEDVGTLFLAGKGKVNARKKWIAFSAARRGSLVLDRGATKALCMDNRSLLASGISKVKGSFAAGNVVELASEDGSVFGRGVVRYSHKELMKIKGKKSTEIKKTLGSSYQNSVIHRDDLVVWAS